MRNLIDKVARLVALVMVLVPAGCITGGDVYQQSGKILDDLEKRREPLYICAPREYAHAEAEARFARTESDYGDTLKARSHLLEAGAWHKKAVDKAFYPDGNPREGCEGDNDDDSILNSKDKCPDVAEDYDNDNDTDGCPEFDKDLDGIPDEKDQCPVDAEDKDGFEDADGCPDLDNDLDGIPDKADKCPNQPEDFDKFQDEDGCPEPDNDADGIPDVKDKCPNDPEDFDGDQDEDGCPDLYKNIIVKEDKIELLQKIFFAFNKDTILEKSYPLLQEVAQALKDHPNIKVRIEGHTDSKGSDSYNLKLSDKRAKSVRDFLIKQGIAPDRMVAIGYGETRPIADNDTEEGREMNRRVEFFITDK
jgi:outer membrane protein OmpA-like peptidoglycan-associated protein